jgi:hypothetical protein
VTKRLKLETPDQTAERRSKTSDSVTKRRKLENPEQTAERRSKTLASVTKRLKLETPDKTLKRQKKQQASRASKVAEQSTLAYVTKQFQDEAKKGCDYICTSCHRLFWPKTMKKLTEKNFSVLPAVKEVVLAKQHKCKSFDGHTYICYTCYNTIAKNKIPAMAIANGLGLDEVPPELQDLNELEQRLLCKRLLFMQLRELPVGKQKGIKGIAVNIPADLGPACTLLPRIPTTAHMVTIKFKRRIKYKHSYIHDTIDVKKVMAAFRFLQKNNPLYQDVELNENWVDTWQQDDPQFYNAAFVGIPLVEAEGLTHSIHVPSDNSQPDAECTASSHESAILQTSQQKLCKVAERHGFITHDVPPDGDCMFSATLHQMEMRGFQSMSTTELRAEMCTHMKKHMKHYKPFVSSR